MDKEKGDILSFTGTVKADLDDMDTFFCADPMREGYFRRQIINTYVDGKYALKNKIKEFIEFRDALAEICRATGFAKEIKFSSLTNPSSRELNYAFVSIVLSSGYNSMSAMQSTEGFSMFKELFMHGDWIEIGITDFDTPYIKFGFTNFWIPEHEAHKYDSENLILQKDITEYIDSLYENKKLSLSSFKQKEAYKSVVRDSAVHFERMQYIMNHFGELPDNAVPYNKTDKSLKAKVEPEVNVIRDALLSLHYNHGIGIGVRSFNVTEENANRIMEYNEELILNGTDRFETEGQLKLFRRCMALSSGFQVELRDQTGTVSVVFGAPNKHVGERD